MLKSLELSRMAQALSAYSGARMGLIAQNVANADTPGYRARDMADFASVWQGGDGLRSSRAGHTGPGADAAQPRVRGPGDASPNGNTVSLEQEMVAAADARQMNDMALAVYRATSDILRNSLGRAR